MNFKVLLKEDLTTTKWQGGTTTQLYIYPEDSSYLERNFQFRISTAEVLTEKSEFTSLPNYNRELMILNGSIEIIHENEYSKKLQKFDIDSFKGSWKTNSIGICTDFNIMTTSSYFGKVEAITSNSSFQIKNTSAFLILYLYKGSATIKNSNKQIELNQGTVFILFDKQNIDIDCHEESEIIVSKISLK